MCHCLSRRTKQWRGQKQVTFGICDSSAHPEHFQARHGRTLRGQAELHGVGHRDRASGPERGEEEAAEHGHDRHHDGHLAPGRTLLLPEDDAHFQVRFQPKTCGGCCGGLVVSIYCL